MIPSATNNDSQNVPEPNPFFPPENGRSIVNELPSELLSHIFTLGWASERDQSDEDDFDDVDEGDSEDGSTSSASSLSDDGRSSTRSALEDEDRRARKQSFNVLVSHVCRRWRAVAVDSSLLWTHIRFEGPPPWERALIYVDRAKTAPLSISIDRTVDDDDDGSHFDDDSEDEDEPKDNDPDLVIITEIMDIVVAHIDHIQVLEIMASFYTHMHRALVKLGATPGAPLLEVLQLYHYEDTDEHDSFKLQELRDQPFVLFSGNAPRLTHVALWGVHLDWSKRGAPFLTGLYDLELAYHARDVRPSFKDFTRVLRASPHLHTLTLSLSGPAGVPGEWPSVNVSAGDDDDDDDDGSAMLVDSSAPLVLSRLQSLMLAYLEPNYLLALLSRLSLPALTELGLDLEDDDYTDFLARRGIPIPAPTAAPLLSNLTALRIASLPCGHEGVVLDAYKQLDKLVAFTLNVLYAGPHWFALLVPSPSPSTSANTNQNELYLPRLESLTTTGVDGAQLRELVEARAARGAPLKEVRMNQDDGVEEDDEAWLKGHLDRFDTFEGSDEEEVVDAFDDDDEDGWEDADDEDDDFDGEHLVVLPF
uniref:PPM-type phosphatase domain-containing protein n=1 Tax=Ganoderma boninense TaxID=34458 RepID=A0A5K1K431_9APHY|nr:PPM-type phosphatase domain-containing protein [Ganoderma boninense]